MIISPPSLENPVSSDPDDDKFIACAIAAKTKVIVSGDKHLLAVDSFPIIDYSTGGWIGGFRAATRHLLELANDATVIVPALGQLQRRRALEAQLELCEATYEIVGQAYVNARSLDELIASRPLETWESERGDPSQFIGLAYRSAWAYLRAMGLGVV